MATIASFKVPQVNNEPNVSCCNPGTNATAHSDIQKHYAPNSPEREKLGAAIAALKKRAPIEVPVVIGGKEVDLPVTMAMNRI